jgi:DNA-binding protein YbaB
MTAFNDASQKASELSEQRMGALTGGMKLPGF